MSQSSSRQNGLKIFLSTLLIYSLFSSWYTQYFDSTLDLTKALIHENKFQIDNYYNNTIDWVRIGSHYYSDKNPGLAFLSVPIYSIFSWSYPGFDELGENNTITTNVGSTTLYYKINNTFHYNFMIFFLIVLTSSLPAALVVLLLYKFSINFISEEKMRIFFSFSVGFSTMIFPYATSFFNYQTANLLVLLSFYFLFQSKVSGTVKNKNIFLSAFFCGISLFFSRYCMFFIPIFAFYSASIRKDLLTKFLVVSLISTLPFLIYNTAVTGNPFLMPYKFYNPDYLSDLLGIFGEHWMTTKNWDSLLFLQKMAYNLVSPYKGLLFYSPLLLLSLFGVIFLWKKFKAESILIMLVFTSFLIFNSFFINPAWTDDFCIRNFTLIIPLLTISLAPLFNRRKWVCLLTVVVVYGFLMNLTAFQTPGDPSFLQSNGVGISLAIKSPTDLGLYDFSVYSNKLLNLLSIGPRSRLLESFFMGEPFDTRYTLPEQREFVGVFLIIPFLPVIVSSLVIFAIWYKELIPYTSSKWFVISFLILVASYMSHPTKLNVERGFHTLAQNEQGKWMMDDAFVNFISFDSNIQMIRFTASSYPIDRNLSLLFNNEKLLDIVVSNDKNLEFTSVFRPNFGMNTIYFDVQDRCIRPVLEEGTDDIRCLSIHLWDYTIESFNSTWSYGKYWYPQAENEEGKWFAQNATLLLFPEGPIQFEMTFWSMFENRTLNIYLDEQPLTTLYLQNNTKQTYISPAIGSESTLRFETIGNCMVPADLENGWDDYRCLGVQLNSITPSD